LPAKIFKRGRRGRNTTTTRQGARFPSKGHTPPPFPWGGEGERLLRVLSSRSHRDNIPENWLDRCPWVIGLAKFDVTLVFAALFSDRGEDDPHWMGWMQRRHSRPDRRTVILRRAVADYLEVEMIERGEGSIFPFPHYHG
jgi:hypothetical protein